MSGEDRRRQIVEVAADLFSKKGFSGTTTKEIADCAGVSEAIIFRHFATKRDLYTAILGLKSRQRSGDIKAKLEGVAAEKNDREFFRLLAEDKLETYMTDSSLMRLLLFSSLEGHELTDIFYESSSKEILEYLRAYIKERIADGAFRDLDPALCAKAFLGMVVNHAIAQTLSPDLDDVRNASEEVVNCFVEIFLGGMYKREKG
ncbi:MAG TPA: TetR/AcrR family transcriptional regulator [Blastocatellia bacterium]|nr:TetR/AcrR family transcriptional regulator [Blastocatellia bacterium]